MADATRSSEVETKQTLAPTLEDGTLQTADDGEPNPPTGAALSRTIAPDQFNRVMSAVKRMNAEGMQKQAMELMDSFLLTVNNDVSTIMTPPPSQANSGARGVRVGIEPTKPAFRTCRGLRPAPLKASPETLSPHRWWGALQRAPRLNHREFGRCWVYRASASVGQPSRPPVRSTCGATEPKTIRDLPKPYEYGKRDFF